MTSMTHAEPRITAVLYTEEISDDYFTGGRLRTHGWRRDGKTWARVVVGGLDLTAQGEAGLAGMLRLADALQATVAQARQAEQDETLVDVDLTDIAVSA